jgi:hypothetical protein
VIDLLTHSSTAKPSHMTAEKRRPQFARQ